MDLSSKRLPVRCLRQAKTNQLRLQASRSGPFTLSRERCAWRVSEKTSLQPSVAIVPIRVAIWPAVGSTKKRLFVPCTACRSIRRQVRALAAHCRLCAALRVVCMMAGYMWTRASLKPPRSRRRAHFQTFKRGARVLVPRGNAKTAVLFCANPLKHLDATR